MWSRRPELVLKVELLAQVRCPNGSRAPPCADPPAYALVLTSSRSFDATSNSCSDRDRSVWAVSVSFRQTYWAFSASSDFERAGARTSGRSRARRPRMSSALRSSWRRRPRRTPLRISSALSQRAFPNWPCPGGAGPRARLPAPLGSLSSASDGRSWQARGVLFPVSRSPFEREAPRTPAFAPRPRHGPPLEVTYDGLALPRASVRGPAGSMEAYYAEREAGPS